MMWGSTFLTCKFYMTILTSTKMEHPLRRRDFSIPRLHREGLGDPALLSTKLQWTSTNIDSLPASLLTVDYDIRHQIYGHFFVMNKAVYLTELYPEMFHMELEHASTARSFNRGHPRDGGHSLMLTCRQLNNEITELFYGTNCFVVQPGQKKFSPRCMSVRSYHFLPDLRQSTMRMLTRVELILGPCIDWRAITAIQKTATTISDLQNLKIRIYSSKKGDGESRRDENDLIVDACKLILGARGSNDRDLWQIRGVGSDFDGLSRALQCEIPALEILAPDQKLRNLYRWLRD